uniref:Reverse transcriptase domain-containing protein n=1 Tax=Amphimedon queenslandica TaxID=400682 RepID=A0A1X7VL89_AMPQE
MSPAIESYYDSQVFQLGSPIPVIKQDGNVRICGDYKVTVNQVSPTETYPLPRVEDLFTALSGCKVFSKLDLSSAY